MTDTTTLQAPPRVDYRTEPGQYRHWSLSFDGAIARLVLDIAEDGGIRPATSSSSTATTWAWTWS